MWQCWRLLEGTQNRKNSEVFLQQEGGWSWKNSETPSERKGSCPLTVRATLMMKPQPEITQKIRS